MRNRASAALFWVAAFLIPIALLAAVCAWNGVFPFGPESFMTEDTKYQYVDFFTWFKRVLAGQTSVFYVDNTGLGNNAWGLVGYYLSSPFNVLLPLFGEGQLVLFFWVITALKLGCAQVSTMWYLLRRFRLQRGEALVLALAFTWSLWTATQLRNPLWLDALIVLPLVAYALYLLIRDARWMPLAISWAAAIIVCWYTAYMIIIFSCLFVLLELVASERLKGVEIAKRVGLFCLAGVAAVALAAFTFAPTIMAMMGGTSGTKPYLTYMTDIRQLLAGFVLGDWVQNSTAQHFAGTLVAILVVAFFVVRGIPARVKVAAGIFLVFMVASAYIAWLLWFWSGLRMPTGFYCRITFLTAFLAVWMCAWTLRALRANAVASLAKAGEGAAGEGAKVSKRPWLPLVIGGAVVMVFTAAMLVKGWIISPINVAVIVVVTAACCVLGVLYLRSIRSNAAAEGGLHAAPAHASNAQLSEIAQPAQTSNGAQIALQAGLVAVVFLELLYCAHLAWGQLYINYPQQYHDEYVQQSTEQLAELHAADDGLYRVDKTYTRAYEAARNEGLTRDYLALATYASSQDINAVRFLQDVGYSVPGEFQICFTEPMVAMDALLGVKYVSSDHQPAGYVETDLMTVDGSSEVESATFYRNTFALPLAYGVSEDAVNFAFEDGTNNPFEHQNALVSALLGYDVQLYRPMEQTVTESSDTSATYQVNVPAGQIGYVYGTAQEGSFMMSIDGGEAFEEHHRWRNAVTPFGQATARDSRHTVTISVKPVDPNDRNAVEEAKTNPTTLQSQGAQCYFYALDLQVLRQVTDLLAAQPAEFDTFESGHIKLHYTAATDGHLMITVPAAKGWTLKVNGQTQELQQACNGTFMLVPVQAGENDVELTFMSPGFIPGCIVSAAALVLLLVAFAISRARRSRTH